MLFPNVKPRKGRIKPMRQRLLRLSLVSFLCTVLWGPVMAIERTKPNDKVPADPVLRRKVLRFAAAADRFRLLASEDLSRAVNLSGDKQFTDKWRELISPYFQKEDHQWTDFFSGAVILLGRCEDARLVVAFYNPWIDALLLTEWEAWVSDHKMSNFWLFIGESWRGEKLDAATGDIPPWETRKEPAADAVSRYYAQTVEVFNEAYPIAGDYIALPETIAGRLEKNQLAELGVIKARMIHRLRLCQGVLSSEHGEKLKSEIDKTRIALVGTLSDFSDSTGPSQDTFVAESIFKMPIEFRTGLVPVFLLIKDQRGLVIFQNPRLPRWFVTADLNLMSNGGLSSVGLYEFELAAKILQAQENAEEPK